MNPDLLSIPSILKRPGGTRGLIKRFLDKPDDTRKNPVYRTAAPMQLFLCSRVEAVEQTEPFRVAAVSATKRQKVGLQVAAKKREEAIQWARGIPIQVRVMPLDTAIQNACKHYNRRQEDRLDFYGGCPDFDAQRAKPGSLTEPFRDRITVNYLRHECSSYEGRLDATFGRVGVEDAKYIIRTRVYQAIAEGYPSLAPECSRQLLERTPVKALPSEQPSQGDRTAVSA